MKAQTAVPEERFVAQLDSVYRTALCLTGDPESASDLVERTARGALRRVGEERDPGRYRVLLFQLLLSEAGWKARPDVGATAATLAGLGGVSLPDDISLLTAVLALESTKRVALWLHDVELFTAADAARIMGLDKRSFQSTLFNARVELKLQMQKILKETLNRAV